MPDVDGFALARQIQEDPALAMPQIMMLCRIIDLQEPQRLQIVHPHGEWIIGEQQPKLRLTLRHEQRSATHGKIVSCGHCKSHDDHRHTLRLPQRDAWKYKIHCDFEEDSGGKGL